MTSGVRGLVRCMVVVIGGLGAAPATAADALPARAEAVLKTHCARCHGPDSPGKGGFDFVLDRDKLVALQKVLPGHAADSKPYQRARDGKMPPRSLRPRPGPPDLAALARCIDAGALG